MSHQKLEFAKVTIWFLWACACASKLWALLRYDAIKTGKKQIRFLGLFLELGFIFQMALAAIAYLGGTPAYLDMLSRLWILPAALVICMTIEAWHLVTRDTYPSFAKVTAVAIAVALLSVGCALWGIRHPGQAPVIFQRSYLAACGIYAVAGMLVSLELHGYIPAFQRRHINLVGIYCLMQAIATAAGERYQTQPWVVFGAQILLLGSSTAVHIGWARAFALIKDDDLYR